MSTHSCPKQIVSLNLCFSADIPYGAAHTVQEPHLRKQIEAAAISDEDKANIFGGKAETSGGCSACRRRPPDQARQQRQNANDSTRGQMMRDVSGKVAFVTGAASGIGFGIARALAGAGMKVVMADIDAKRVQAAVRELDPSGGSVLPVALDIRNRQDWQRAAQAAEEKFGAVHVLCNNAGIAPAYKPIEQLEPDAWDLMLQVNLTGAFNGLHAFVPRMKAHGQGGHIVNVSSMSGLYAQPGMSDYGAAKFGVVGLSESIRAELAPANIGVSVICPGAVKSLLWRTSRKLRGLPDIDTPPETSMGGSASPTGRDPAWVGRRVLQAIRENEFYVVTHLERLKDVKERFAAIAAGFEATAAYMRDDPVGS